MIGCASDISSPLHITLFMNSVMYTSSSYSGWSGLGYMPVVGVVGVRVRLR